MKRKINRTKKKVEEILPRNFKEKLKKERHCLYYPGSLEKHNSYNSSIHEIY